MKYVSTRNTSREYSASEAILKGISDDGGLFVPSSFPNLDGVLFDSLLRMDYQERAAKILSLFIDDFTFEELLDITNAAYSHFEGDDPCPVVKIEDSLYMLELWHGPTCAFKDMALTVLPHLIVGAKRKLGLNEKTLVLVATSGDTGKAALEGFKDVDGTEVIVFYPSKGVSEVQRLQMVTQEGGNVHVAGIRGNFDDAQTAVKKVFNDKDIIDELASLGYKMSSANSINWGRLAPQIAYYISAYCDLVNGGEIAFGDKVNFVVPTGNFGNVLAGYYAYRMGLPVNKLIIASNSNNVLTDFFNTGVYDINRIFYKTSSPSMDILVSSNLERLVFEASGRDDATVRKLYSDCAKEGKFTFDTDRIRGGVFEAGWADEDDVMGAIDTFFDLDDYVMDTHTAVAASVYNDYSCETDDDTPTVIVSTANPFKFAPSVLNALGIHEKNAFKALAKLQTVTALDCPESLATLKDKEEIHSTVVDSALVGAAVINFVKNK